MKTRKINFTVVIEDSTHVQYQLEQTLKGVIGEDKIIDLKVFPNTQHLKDNTTFKKLIKAKRDAGRELDRFINNNRV